MIKLAGRFCSNLRYSFEGIVLGSRMWNMDRPADILILQFAQPGGRLWPIAVLALDVQADRLYVRSRLDFCSGISLDDAEVVSQYIAQIAEEGGEQSGQSLLKDLEERLSNTIRISERRRIQFQDLAQTLDALARDQFGP